MILAWIIFCYSILIMGAIVYSAWVSQSVLKHVRGMRQDDF